MSVSMTPSEKMLWDYIEDESNELFMRVVRNVREDGFGAEDPERHGPEVVALKVVSAAMVKLLAITSEERGVTDIVKAYMDMVPLHAELIKVYAFRALERETRR